MANVLVVDDNSDCVDFLDLGTGGQLLAHAKGPRGMRALAIMQPRRPDRNP
jgi:hypothetical protein